MGLRSTLTSLRTRLARGDTVPVQEDTRTVDLDAALARYRVEGEPRPTPAEVVASMSQRELRAEAKRRGLRGYSRMSKAQLRRALGGE